jgi:hypothetical protein
MALVGNKKRWDKEKTKSAFPNRLVYAALFDIVSRHENDPSFHIDTARENPETSNGYNEDATSNAKLCKRQEPTIQSLGNRGEGKNTYRYRFLNDHPSVLRDFGKFVEECMDETQLERLAGALIELVACSDDEELRLRVGKKPEETMRKDEIAELGRVFLPALLAGLMYHFLSNNTDSKIDDRIALDTWMKKCRGEIPFGLQRDIEVGCAMPDEGAEDGDAAIDGDPATAKDAATVGGARGGEPPQDAGRAYDWQPPGDAETTDKDGRHRYDARLGLPDFQDDEEDLEDLIAFIESEVFDFRWWSICGKRGGGKTRYSLELKSAAEDRMWGVHYFSNEDTDHYTKVTKLPLPMDRHTLLIFDDADMYDVQTEKGDERVAARNRVAVRGFFDSFALALSKPIEKSGRRNKLRIIFTYSHDSAVSDDIAFKRLWWKRLLNPFGGGSEHATAPKAIQWSRMGIVKLIDNYRKHSYGDAFPNDVFDGFAKKLAEWMDIPENADFTTPLTGMFCLDAYVRGRKKEDLSELLGALPIRLARMRSENPAELYRLDEYIERIEDYIKDFYKQAADATIKAELRSQAVGLKAEASKTGALRDAEKAASH